MTNDNSIILYTITFLILDENSRVANFPYNIT